MLHITIGTAPLMPPSLETDLRLVKASLLYADKTKLCSGTYSGWLSELSLKDSTIEEHLKQWEELEQMVPFMFSSQQEIDSALYSLRMARKSLQNKQPTIKDLLFRADLIKGAREMYASLNLEGVDKIRKEFDSAVNAGLLEIHSFEILESEKIGLSSLNGTFDKSLERLADEFVTTMMSAVSDSTTYPLFDDATGDIVKLGIDAGVRKPTRVAQGKQTKLATETLWKLPLFVEASIDEILDIRRELKPYLVRFRAAIIKYSETIKNAAWDAEFSVEADEVFHRDIAPAVADIEDAVRTNSSLFALTTRKLIDKPALASTGIFSFIVSQLSLFPTITNLAMGMGVGAAAAIYDAYKEQQKQQTSVEQNQLYFYYHAGELLSNRTFEHKHK